VSWLNYHHLYYFWTVARTGSVSLAARELGVSQPAISTQLKQLEAAVGEKLLTRKGRGLELTEAGRVALTYAEDIFSTGREMLEALRGKSTTREARLQVGIADVVPKLVAHRLLEPALALTPRVRVVCREESTERLLAELEQHSLDLVLADRPVSGPSRVRAFNHPLGESPVALFGVPALARRLRGGFPGSLQGAPLLLPAQGTALRRSIDGWLDQASLRATIVAEFDDSALMKVFAQHGAGVCPAPRVIARELQASFGIVPVGVIPKVVERYFAISVERRIRHPAIMAITEHARTELFK
jgi:LysR family transcriptional regulator, transcriptional activator of nhaA